MLAAVFATAAVGKLMDREGSRTALSDFGLPGALVPATAILLPLAELATAIALIPAETARWGGLAAALLLLAFIAGILNALRRGEAPDCHCFGQIHSAPAGRKTLLRNGGLAAIAVLIVAEGPGPEVGSWISDRLDAELVAVATGAAAIALGIVAFQLFAERRTLRTELDFYRSTLQKLPQGLPVGAQAPDFELPDLRGNVHRLSSFLAAGRPVVLVFVSPDCGSCQMIYRELGWWQEALADQLTVVPVNIGTADDGRALAAEHGIETMLVQESAAVLGEYQVSGTPAALVVSPDGSIASSVVSTSLSIEPLLRLTMRRANETGRAVAAVPRSSA